MNIQHVQNEFFRNDSPIKNLQELRKEVKELYNDFEFEENEENCSTNNIRNINSLENNSISNLKTFKTIKKTDEVNESFYNNEPKPEPEQYNNEIINESVKKYNLIPHEVDSLKINRENNEYRCPRLLSKKKILKSYRRARNNYSFDNKEKMLFDENDMENIKRMKYSCYDNHSITNVNNANRSIKKNFKLKPTVLRFQNNDNRLKKKYILKIPAPHLPSINDNNNRYNDSYINDENENYENINYSNHNNSYKNYQQFNTAVFHSKNSKKVCNNNYDELNRNERRNSRVVYLCEPMNNPMNNTNFEE